MQLHAEEGMQQHFFKEEEQATFFPDSAVSFRDLEGAFYLHARSGKSAIVSGCAV